MKGSVLGEEELLGALDRIRIAELYGLYSMANDEQDLDLLAECFIDEAEFTSEMKVVPPRKGLTEIRERLIYRHQEKKFRERHITSFPVIRFLSKDQAEASAEVAIFVCEEGSKAELQVIGRYDDSLVKRGERWRFARRKFIPDG